MDNQFNNQADRQASEQRKQQLIRSTYRMALFGIALAGFVSIMIIGIAILIGLFLDDQFGSSKNFYTFIMILISVPLNVVGLLWVVRFTTKRFSADNIGTQKNNLQEDDNSVGS